MKKAIYIVSFTFLGLLISFILHAILEIWYIKLLVGNYARHGLSMDWTTWFELHKYWSAAMLLLGAAWGLLSGKYWWQQIYVLKRSWRK